MYRENYIKTNHPYQSHTISNNIGANPLPCIQYIVAVLVVLGLQLAGGIVGFVHREMVLETVRDGLNATLPRYNGATGADRGITTAWDKVQEQVTMYRAHHAHTNIHTHAVIHAFGHTHSWSAAVSVEW